LFMLGIFCRNVSRNISGCTCLGHLWQCDTIKIKHPTCVGFLMIVKENKATMAIMGGLPKPLCQYIWALQWLFILGIFCRNVSHNISGCTCLGHLWQRNTNKIRHTTSIGFPKVVKASKLTIAVMGGLAKKLCQCTWSLSDLSRDIL
jgi:hypothetical protein